MLKLDILVLSFLSTVMGELDFAVHVEGGSSAADKLAEKHHMKNMGEVIPDTNYFLLRTLDNSRRKRSVKNLTHVFDTDPEVDWAEYQSPKIRVKRNPIYSSDSYSYKFGRRLVDNLLPRKVSIMPPIEIRLKSRVHTVKFGTK